MNMEFPELGANCTLNTCKQLDFLPMKCDACSKLFCKDHIKYTEHSCENAYKKDFQVPVCPLCNKAVPVPRGEQPDIKVGEHIDRDCQSDPAVAKRKAYQNRCSLKGCKQKELIPVRCESCRQNFCLKHRHEQDHNCSGVIRGASRSKTSASLKAGEAAATRAKNVASSSKVHKKPQQTSLSSIGRDLDRSRRERQMTAPNPQPIPQPALSEDEALALAIQASLQDQSKTKSPSPPLTTQEEEDQALARALAESEREEQKRRRQQEQQKKSDCRVT